MSLKFSGMVSMCNAQVSIYTIQFDARTTQIHSQYNSIINAIVYDHLLNIIIAMSIIFSRFIKFEFY